MAKILYGVSGEGSGHAVRSREVMRHLRAQGHEIQVVTHGRAYDLLQDEFQSHEVFGLSIDYQNNSVRYIPTLWKNAINAPAAVESLSAVGELMKTTRPDIVLTDFEPLVALQASRFAIPILAIDNIHHVVYRRERTPWRYRQDRLVARSVVRLMVPQADYRIVTTFDGMIRAHRRTQGIFPIIRPEIFAAHATTGEHLVVYDSFANNALPEHLANLPYEFHVYGYGREGRVGNVEYRTFSEKGFLDDLRTGRAVIGTAGFTLISECLVLRKPYLALPIAGQFEQIDNALMLEALGGGEMARDIDQGVIERFLDNVPKYNERLAEYHHPGSRPGLKIIEEAIVELLKGH